VQTGRRSVVTIGAYDGVHIGHRQVLDAVRRLATEHALDSVVVTFDRHPASVVRPESAPKLLCDLDQKLELLSATGVDRVVLIDFDQERADEQAEEFVEEVLGAQLAASFVVVGRDFHFGKDRGGDVALLEKMGADLGFGVIPFGLVPDPVGGKIVSSTGIRKLIAAGELGEAARLLGRPHEVRGRVRSLPHRPAGQGAFCAEVPTEILRPPPGTYNVLAGLASADGSEAAPPVRSRAVVPADETAPLEVDSLGGMGGKVPSYVTPGRQPEASRGSAAQATMPTTDRGVGLDGPVGRVLFIEGRN
jgi:riboflavin kinase/FMN adenylyltransferase